MHANANGIDLHYLMEGPADAPVVMLSHSLATNHAMWEPQITVLTRNYRVLRYDTRGHGASGAPQGPYTLEMMAEDAVGLLDVLDIEKVHWVGISMSGMIGQAMALAAPSRLHSLTLCDTLSQIPATAAGMWRERIETAEREGMEPLVEPTIGHWLSPEFCAREPAFAERIKNMIRSTPVTGYLGCCHAIRRLNFTDALAKVKLPTLLMVGENDHGVPMTEFGKIQDKIEGSKLLVLPGAYHLSNIDAAENFNSALIEFLDLGMG